MKTTQHTPGNWSVWKFGESEIDVAVGPEVGGLAVCQIVTSQANGISTPESMALGQSNARLIASAPQLLEERDALLEALRECLEVLQSATIDTSVGFQFAADLGRAKGRAKLAIAKATGEKP